FVARYAVNGKPLEADIVVAVTASADHTRSGSWPAWDDPDSGGIAYTLDQDDFQHSYRYAVPGTIALHYTASPLIPCLHEFSHAASSWNNGYVFDLYNDDPAPGSTLLVNKKWGRPIPQEFGVYRGHTFQSDLTRDHLGYQIDGVDMSTYHCELADPSRPAL